jgi:hypothetical protein
MTSDLEKVLKQKWSHREKALIFLYLLAKGMPPWAKGPMGQAVVFSKLAEISLDEAMAALQACVSEGWADQEDTGGDQCAGS